MPAGVLIDDMAFSLDPVSSPNSPFFEAMSPSSPHGFYQHQHPPASSSPQDVLAKHHHSLFHHYDQQALLETIIASAVSSGSPSSCSSFSSNQQQQQQSPTSPISDCSPRDCSGSLNRFLPSNTSDESTWSAEDVYSCDEFRMFEFKVRRCMRGRSHDWTECPFAHPGEKARRRDPRRFHYSGTACPDFRKGSCKNGDACELAHGVFECWLHPARYRTQPCKDGRSCKRRVCFFAHTAEQLRLLPQVSQAMNSTGSSVSSSDSLPCSPRRPSGASSSSASSGASISLLRSLSDHNNPGGGASSKCLEESNSPRSTCSCQHRTGRIISSPTSTLVGLAQSPPPLSPPLSPSQSPPMSPSQSISSSQIQQIQQQIQIQQQQRRDSRNRGHHGFVSAPSSPSCAMNPNQKAMCDLVTALQQLELQKSSSEFQKSQAWLNSAAQQQQAQQQAAQQQFSSGPSPLRPPSLNTVLPCGMPCGTSQVPRGMSLSLPCTPTKPQPAARWDTMWEMDSEDSDLLGGAEEDMLSMSVPRVESGRDLRAKIYSRLAGRQADVFGAGFGGAAGSAARFDDSFGNAGGEPSPDLNWVNDLVTE